MSNQIEVRTTIPFDGYQRQYQELFDQTDDAGIFIMFSADTVARTFAARAWGPWFDEQGLFFMDQFGWSEFNNDVADAVMGCVDADDIDGPMTIVWLFDGDNEQEKAAALLFKLTHGGC